MKKAILPIILLCFFNASSPYCAEQEQPTHMTKFKKEMWSCGDLKALQSHVELAFKPVVSAFEGGVSRRDLNQHVDTLKQGDLSLDTIKNFPFSILQKAHDDFWHLWTKERTPGISMQSEVAVCINEIRDALNQSNKNSEAYDNDAHFLETLETFQAYMDAFEKRYHRRDFTFIDYDENIFWVGACNKGKGSQHLLLEHYPWRNHPDAKEKSCTQKRCFLGEIGFPFWRLRDMNEMVKKNDHTRYLANLTQEEWDAYIDQYAQELFNKDSYQRRNAIQAIEHSVRETLHQGDKKYSEYSKNFVLSINDAMITLDRVLPIYVKSPSDYGDATLKILFKQLAPQNPLQPEITPFWKSLLTNTTSIKQAIDLYAMPVNRTQKTYREAAITHFIQQKIDTICTMIDSGAPLEPLLDIYGIHFTPIPIQSYPA